MSRVPLSGRPTVTHTCNLRPGPLAGMDASVPCCSAQRSRVHLLVRPGLLLLMVCLLMVECAALFAQEPIDPSTINLPPSTPEGLTGFIVGLVTQYPWLATVLLVIG